MSIRRHFIAACFMLLLPFGAYSAAPVVDDSDNFATFDQERAADEQPLAQDSRLDLPAHRDFSDHGFVEERPLARESAHAASNNNAALLAQVQSMQKEIQELRGQVEMQGHEIKQLKEQQLTFYKDLDARIHQSTTHSTVGTTPSEKPSATTTATTAPSEKVVSVSDEPLRSNNPAEEQIHYLAAYDLIKNKRFNDAIVAMQQFVTQYPNGGYTANAHYWLGELYLAQKDYPKAITEFDTVLSKFPASSKAAASLLKSAYALADSGKKQEAIVRLKQITKQYPDTNTAKMANNKLRTLNR